MQEQLFGWVSNTMVINGYADNTFDMPTRIFRIEPSPVIGDLNRIGSVNGDGTTSAEPTGNLA